MPNVAVILPAAGQSRRFHDKAYKKPFVPLANRAVWLHSAERFMNRDDVKQTIVVIPAEDREFFHMKYGANVAIMGVEVIDGGVERADSVQRALERVRQRSLTGFEDASTGSGRLSRAGGRSACCSLSDGALARSRI